MKLLGVGGYLLHLEPNATVSFMVATPLLLTIRDLDAMPDDGGWSRPEMIDGDLLVIRAPHLHPCTGVNRRSSFPW